MPDTVIHVSSPKGLRAPAIVSAIALGFLCLFIMLPLDVRTASQKATQKKPAYNIWYRLLLVLTMLLPSLLYVYSINCMWVGECYIWSWVNSAMSVAWCLLFIIVMLVAGSTQAAAPVVIKPQLAGSTQAAAPVVIKPQLAAAAAEGATLKFACSNPSVSSATYNERDGKRFLTVTERVKSGSASGSMLVTNNTMGGDPAPYKRKVANVKYTC